MRKYDKYSPIWIACMSALISGMGVAGVAIADTVVIDDMIAKQGSDVSPAVVTNVVGETKQAPAFSDPSILWQSRILEITHTAGTGPSTSSYVDSGTPSVWAVANPPGSTGWGRVIWNGSNDPNGLSATPLDLTELQYFNIAYASSDHTTSFILQVFSDATHCSQATIATWGVGGGTALNKHILPSDFAQCAGAAGLAQANSIRKIQISFTPFLDIDTQLRGVAVVRNEPARIQCGYKQINGQSTYIVSGAGPFTLPVQFMVNNIGGSDSQISVSDQLPANSSYVPGSTSCADGFSLGEPDLTNPALPLWKSTSSLAAGKSAVCNFNVTLNTLAQGVTATDVIRAGTIGGPVGPEQCPASVVRSAPPPPSNDIPTMNEWAMLLTAGLLALLGVFTLRRREG